MAFNETNIITKIVIPGSDTPYEIADAAARAAIDAGMEIVVIKDGELPEASAATKGKLYFLGHSHGTGDVFDEYVTVEDNGVYSWEKIGNTDIDLSGYSVKGHTHLVTSNVSVADINYTPAGTNEASEVSFTGTTSDNFVQSYPGVTQKLQTTSVESVSTNSDVTASHLTAAGTAGSAAQFSANVDANGVLTFAWTANTPTVLPTFENVTASKVATSAVTVADGTLGDAGSGADVMTGLGTAVTASAINNLGTATAAAQKFNGTQETLVHNVTNAQVSTGADV